MGAEYSTAAFDVGFPLARDARLLPGGVTNRRSLFSTAGARRLDLPPELRGQRRKAETAVPGAAQRGRSSHPSTRHSERLAHAVNRGVGAKAAGGMKVAPSASSRTQSVARRSARGAPRGLKAQVTALKTWATIPRRRFSATAPRRR